MGGKEQEQETGGFYFMTCFSVEAKGHLLTTGKDLTGRKLEGWLKAISQEVEKSGIVAHIFNSQHSRGRGKQTSMKLGSARATQSDLSLKEKKNLRQ